MAAEVTSERRDVSLGECAVINDSTYSLKEGWETVYYLDTGNISENRVSEIQHLERGKHKIPSRARRKVKPGDIVYSTVRPNQKHFGILKNIPANFLASTGFAVLRGKPGIADTRFLYWFLAQDQVVDYLHSIAENSTSAYPSIKPSDLGQLTLSLPPLPEQRSIAGVLGALDDKIELNRRMNETLEQMARALFKSWFVDFDPVRAKMEGRWRPGQSLPGLPAHLYDLFPSRLVSSELGKVPEGWQVRTLGDFGEIITGKTPSTRNPRLYGTDIPFLKIPDMRGRAYVVETETMLSSAGASSQAGKSLPAGSISVSCIATPGLVILNHRRTHTNQQINSIVPRDNGTSKYLYWSCRRLASEIMLRGSGGSVFHNMNKSTFCALELLDPGIKIYSSFEQLVSPFHEMLLCNEQANKHLAAQRDTLLQRLVSGDLRIGSKESQQRVAPCMTR